LKEDKFTVHSLIIAGISLLEKCGYELVLFLFLKLSILKIETSFSQIAFLMARLSARSNLSWFQQARHLSYKKFLKIFAFSGIRIDF